MALHSNHQSVPQRPPRPTQSDADCLRRRTRLNHRSNHRCEFCSSANPGGFGRMPHHSAHALLKACARVNHGPPRASVAGPLERKIGQPKPCSCLRTKDWAQDGAAENPSPLAADGAYVEASTACSCCLTSSSSWPSPTSECSRSWSAVAERRPPA